MAYNSLHQAKDIYVFLIICSYLWQYLGHVHFFELDFVFKLFINFIKYSATY